MAGNLVARRAGPREEGSCRESMLQRGYPGLWIPRQEKGALFHIVGMTLFAHASMSWAVWVGAGQLASLGFFHFETTGIAIYARTHKHIFSRLQ